MSVQQQEEAVSIRPLIENRGAPREPDRARFAQQFILFGRRKAGEYRQTGD
jgi:hypothetical protein